MTTEKISRLKRSDFSKRGDDIPIGKHILTFDEMVSITPECEIDRPVSKSVSNIEDIVRPDMDSMMTNIEDSQPMMRIGYGTDPHQFVAQDWKRYNLYKSKHPF